MNNTEIELKLLIDPADVPGLRRHPLLKTLCPAGPATRRLVSTYFDTDDFALKNHGIALRVRRDGRKWIQTVKGGGSVQAGLHQRGEWEAPVTHNAPDFTKITDPGLIGLFAAEELRQRLRPVFVTEFTRIIWLLETEAGDRIEMALDRGEVRAGQERSPISEVELELKAGNPAALFDVALTLQESVALRTENASKAERGYALCAAPVLLPAVKAQSPIMTRKIPVDAAFRAIAWNCIAQLQGNQGCLQQGYDAECVHQMRVAVRRLRSAINLFSAAAPGLRNETLLDELRWLASELGAARDLDVFVDGTLAQVLEAMPGDEGLKRLELAVARLAQKKRAGAREAANSLRYHRLLLALGRWLWREPWREGLASPEVLTQLDQPLADFAVNILAQRHRQLRRRGRKLAQLDAKQRHAVRIAAKKQRYAMEFFSSLFPRKGWATYLKAMTHLQDELGVLNDHAVTARLLAEIGDGWRDILRNRAIGVIFGWNTCKTHDQLAGMTQAWRNLKRQKIFWEKG
ncbi:MAG: CHAD domain-containing protein [Sulfuricella sp.]|nr:CHAD domain-containing protein [Sulfuricella sp.]